MTAPRTKPLVWALDVATVTGFARGRAGEKPHAESIRFAPAGSLDDVLFCGCLEWFTVTLNTGPLPDVLAIEQLLPPTARRGETNTGAQHRLAGLHGIIRALARRAEIVEVSTVRVSDIRQHFISNGHMRSAEAKRAVQRMCKLLDWDASDDNAADALALWSYAVALINPMSALQVTPLFGSWEDVARARAAKA